MTHRTRRAHPPNSGRGITVGAAPARDVALFRPLPPPRPGIPATGNPPNRFPLPADWATGTAAAPLNGAAAGLAVIAAEAQLGGTDNGPSDAALPTSAAMAEGMPAVNSPAAGAAAPTPDSAEPRVAASLATTVVDEPRSFATELTEDIADIVELIVEAAALAGDVNEDSRLRHSAKVHPEVDAATGCASCCNARGTVETALSVAALTAFPAAAAWSASPAGFVISGGGAKPVKVDAAAAAPA